MPNARRTARGIPSGDPHYGPLPGLHDQERFSRTFTEQVAKLGLPAIPLHALRHGWATLALTAGVHPKVVQERLGHANISITRGRDSHRVRHVVLR